VKKYINNQKEHFKEEFLSFLREFKTAFKDKYIFDFYND